ncbi:MULTISPECIES: GNAT family N-acetyltransferase [unclassified Rathayibacter]|uniref:GNAT family N-acetyltransferase n=1 Tax=unclassified Rathayibacter TaxID=2609250 RepID=UPI00188ADC21|nr:MULTISPECIES: GNAT family N-acetyltransferase [unclassified Rathayibacter]MBF4462956.1 N-acetyltransferase [Rathayibacter sp. VKM Ac-2879]MBF4504370.1 N-acetyltransferase [Rathayibacter sp. VKM Ac-2878]
MTDTDSPAVRDVPERSRFEIEVGGTAAGFAAYVRHDDEVVLTHTVIDEGWEGRGLGGVLARAAVLAITEAGGTVVPRCPFIASWLRKHPDVPARVRWPED